MDTNKIGKIPRSEEGDPLSMLTDTATSADWNNNKLPPDIVCIQNGSILCNSQRWSLIVDPQLQGITWLRSQYKELGLYVLRLTDKKYKDSLFKAIENGNPVIFENLQEAIDATIQPVIARLTSKRGSGRVMKLGDRELNYSPNFKMVLHTKLSNPHYPPEIQAECTIINFMVTQEGLEDQLLALVVKMERPDLAKLKEELIDQNRNFMITLSNIEKSLLKQLKEAEGDILENVQLILNLEESKKTSDTINIKMIAANETDTMINETSENYRPVGKRGALAFFLMSELSKMHSF